MRWIRLITLSFAALLIVVAGSGYWLWRHWTLPPNRWRIPTLTSVQSALPIQCRHRAAGAFWLWLAAPRANPTASARATN
jgi:hypothetical protein